MACSLASQLRLAAFAVLAESLLLAASPAPASAGSALRGVPQPRRLREPALPSPVCDPRKEEAGCPTGMECCDDGSGSPKYPGTTGRCYDPSTHFCFGGNYGYQVKHGICEIGMNSCLGKCFDGPDELCCRGGYMDQKSFVLSNSSMTCCNGFDGHYECAPGAKCMKEGYKAWCEAAAPEQPKDTFQNRYEKTEGIGGWGGWCTCPDGRDYNVGDRHDGCANGSSSLACIGGTPSVCNRQFQDSRAGMQVICNAPTSDSPNFYKKAQSGVGGWGGWCTCPNGQRYNVGDLNDGCAKGALSLACVGGAAGECHREFNASREGMRVVCAGAANDYRKAEQGVGGWGGWCTCPDGQRYNVGDTNDGCAHGPSSLACFGGVPGECVREFNASRGGMQVTCAGPMPTAVPTPVPSTCGHPCSALTGQQDCRGECAFCDGSMCSAR